MKTNVCWRDCCRVTLSRISGVPGMLIILLALLTTSLSWGQVSTASINGTVQDSTGALIQGAKIVVTQTETNFTAKAESGDTGFFKISSIPVGPYKVRISKEGFAKYEQNGLVLTVGQVATIPVTLTIGTASQEIVVTTEAPAVESTESTIQSVVEEKTVSELPLNGRNPAALMYTAAGVTDATINQAGTAANSTIAQSGAVLSDESAPTTNGIRPGGTYFSLDGAGNVDPYTVIGGPFPNPDATQEFSVVTGSYGARYVSAPGGAVNIVTKSGTNQIHGSAFEFVRNGYFNAQNHFSTAKDTLKRNQFGFAAGGPIVKDKLFAFGSYQQTLVRAQTIVDDYVGIVTANENMHAGQFLNESTGEVVQLPMSTVAKNLMSYFPSPNYSLDGVKAYFNTTIPDNINNPQWVAKVDYNLQQHRIFARYFSEKSDNPADPMLPSTLTSSGYNALTTAGGTSGFWDSLAIGDTWTSKSANWIVDTRAGWMKADQVGKGATNMTQLSITSLGATGVSDGKYPTLPTFYVIGGFVVSGNPYGDNTRTSWDYSVDVIHPIRKHELSFGTDLRFIGLDQTSYSGQNPAFAFVGLNSLYGGYGYLDNNGFADLILGRPYEFYQADGSFSKIHGNLLGFYGEDKYTMSDRLTITGGLRWDPYLPYVPAKKHIDCWSPGKQSSVFTNAPLGLLFPGDSGCSEGGTTAKFMMIQPRIGFALKLDKQGHTALRAGWGMYSTQFSMISLLGFSAPPYVRSFLQVHALTSQSIDDPWTSLGLSDPFASGFHDANYVPASDVSFADAEAIGFSPSAITSDFKPATVAQWTLSLQHAFTAADSVELAYVGTTGVHIPQSYDSNLPVYNGSASSPSSTRPYASEGLSQLLTLASNSTSNYNGLNATYHHRAKWGLDMVSAFNWSKCMDDGSVPPSTGGAFGATGAGNNLVSGGAFEPRVRRGRCDFDQNLTFRDTVVWNSPSLKGDGVVVKSVFGGWTLSSLVVVDAGQPFSIKDTANNSLTGLGLDRADWNTTSAPAYKNGKLNSAAFQINAKGTYGNVQRNSFRSPRWVHMDPAMMKTFPTGYERIRVMFRAEAFNVFNHTNLLAPESDLNSSSFGTVGGARDPRIMQFSLKAMF